MNAIPGFQPRVLFRIMTRGEVRNASGTDGAASDDVARPYLGAAGGVADHVRERPEEVAVGVQRAVDAGPHAEPGSGIAGPASGSSSAVTKTGPNVVAQSLPLTGPSPIPRSRALQVARAPVAEQQVTGDVSLGPGAGDRLLPAWPITAATSSSKSSSAPPGASANVGRRSLDGCRIGEVERRDLVPRRVHLSPPSLQDRLEDDPRTP